MGKRLAILVLGRRNAGKSTTWNTLFQSTVKTGTRERRLFLNKASWVNVFVVTGSPEERDIPVAELLPADPPAIVLCSAQYRADVTETLQYFFRNGYEMRVQWLNPGYADTAQYGDELQLCPWLLRRGATVQQRDASGEPCARVRELREAILGWALPRGLVESEWPE
jgi:hypothetical protein